VQAKITSVAQQMLENLTTDEQQLVIRDVYDVIPHLPPDDVPVITSESLTEPVAVHQVDDTGLFVLYRFQGTDPRVPQKDLIVIGVLRKDDLEGSNISPALAPSDASLTAQLNAYVTG
jgi:hypothetical protein